MRAASLRTAVRSLHPNATVAWTLFATGVLLVTLLHLFQNGTNIDHRELWLDEASNYLVSRYPVVRLMWLALVHQQQPPLHYLIVHLVSQLSSSEVALRGLSWLFCLLLLYFVLFAMDELHLVSRFAFAVGVIFSEFTHYLAQEMRPYALAALTTLVSSVLLVRLLDEPQSRRRFALYLAAALAMLASLAFDVWVLVAHGVYCTLVMFARGRDRLRPALHEHRLVVLALAIAGAAHLPFVVLAATTAGGRLGAGHPLVPRVLDMVNLAEYGHVLAAYAGAPTTPATALYFGLALSGLFAGLSKKEPLPLLLLLLFFGQIAFVNGFLSGSYGTVVRYYTPAFPIFFWCVALGVERLLGARGRWVVVPGLLAMALLTCACAPAFAAYLRAKPPRANWRRLYDQMHAIPGRKAIFADHGGYLQMLEYVARDDRDFVFFTNQYENVPEENVSVAGQAMTPSYVEASLRASAQDMGCFAYLTNARGKDTHTLETVFLPRMADLGFEERLHTSSKGWLPDPFHDWFDAVVFCRPERP